MVVMAREGERSFDRSLEQRLLALARANMVRSARAQLKRDLKVGDVRLRDVLAEPPATVETMKVLDLLLAAPRIGRVKAMKTLRVCGVSPAKTVGGLSSRQRGELTSLIRRVPDGSPTRQQMSQGGSRCL